jgi:hypothetical protein
VFGLEAGFVVEDSVALCCRKLGAAQDANTTTVRIIFPRCMREVLLTAAFRRSSDANSSTLYSTACTKEQLQRNSHTHALHPGISSGFRVTGLVLQALQTLNYNVRAQSDGGGSEQ